jgi:hypothetical protein
VYLTGPTGYGNPDVACGGGLYALTLAAQHPTARAILLDWANVLERTEDYVDRPAPPLRERTSFLEDAFEVALGGPY